MSIKVAVSSNTCWSIYNFRLGLIKKLSEHYDVFIVAPKDKYSEEIEKLGFKFYDIKMDRKGKNPLVDFETLLEYYKIYKKIKPDIALHFTIKPNIYGNLVCKVLNIPTINNITGLGHVFSNQTLLTKIVVSMYKVALKNSFVFFQNSEDRNMFLELGIVDNRSSDVLPGSGVNVEFFKAVNQKRKGERFTFLFIGRMLKEKGVKEYIKAAGIIKSKYKDVNFLLVGKVDENDLEYVSLSELAMWEKQGVVRYLGETDNPKDVIAKADCVVLPTYYKEGVPKVILESLSMEKPVVTTDVPGCRDAVKNGVNGFLCKPKDVKDLTEKMEKMVNFTEDERRKMGKIGREIVKEKFNEDIVIRKYLNIIEKLT
ncbi:glycosyltransferase family 4 protein [Hippea alviniae]|uniref:glycosyltransferase family 4 protein n=1 Tax=Hippea alviniae TaxID=1279027 RepID=UPI0003B3AE2F|nr:glycosyltransferase family 4 protein [Hippea alviniae]